MDSPQKKVKKIVQKPNGTFLCSPEICFNLSRDEDRHAVSLNQGWKRPIKAAFSRAEML
jgi:hypothetical protein